MISEKFTDNSKNNDRLSCKRKKIFSKRFKAIDQFHNIIDLFESPLKRVKLDDEVQIIEKDTSQLLPKKEFLAKSQASTYFKL